MPSKLKHSFGWITFAISEIKEKEAKSLRAKRDLIYRNIYDEQKTDERWVGELGEMVFGHWLKIKGIRANWITNDAAGRPDFILENGVRIGVKTVKRQVTPSKNYTAQVTAKHVNEKVDHFLFFSYEFPARRMWMVGGIARELFEKQARYYGAGEKVHENYTIRPDHEIYNIEIYRLIPPSEWLRSVIDPSMP